MRAETPYQMTLFPEVAPQSDVPRNSVINVASVPQRSPFRYPGGKTWLVPTARKWFKQADESSELIEPFAGGGIIALTAVAEHFFQHVTMVELDAEIAAAWQTILSEHDYAWLTDKIEHFFVTPQSIDEAIEMSSIGTKELGFATIVRNRTNHGGILAKGSGKIKTGENGKGLASRWYPSTLIRRIKEIHLLRDKISFIHGDAFITMEQYKDHPDTFFFIDPPYTIAGKRLYKHYNVDHQRIFELASQMKGHFLLTYDDTEEIRHYARSFGLPYQTIPMQTTHLITKEELLISDNFDWL